MCKYKGYYSDMFLEIFEVFMSMWWILSNNVFHSYAYTHYHMLMSPVQIHIMKNLWTNFWEKYLSQEGCVVSKQNITYILASCMQNCRNMNNTCVTNLGVYMARFTQFPLMITRSTIIYEIISPGAAGSSIYV